MRTLLFDIDGTLLMTNGGGSNALKLAIEREFGIETARMEVSFAGRTDRSLLVEILQHNDLPVGEDFQQRLRNCYTSVFPRVLASNGGRVLPGIPELLERLSRERLRCYVMTGNLHETATRKLDHFGLLHYFRGIFGGDHDHDRDRLAQRTVDTLRRRYGGATTQDIVIIGDTPADVRCGRAIGAKVVAVCTGNFTREQLEAENPTSVHDDFSDVAALFDLLTH